MGKSSQKKLDYKVFSKRRASPYVYFRNQFDSICHLSKKLTQCLSRRSRASIVLFTEIDQISLGGNISNTVSKCKRPSDVSCEILLENLLGLRNRFYDYSILLWNTLGYPKDSQPVSKLLEREKAVGDFINKYFGISLNEAKKQNAFTPQAYLELVQEKTGYSTHCAHWAK